MLYHNDKQLLVVLLAYIQLNSWEFMKEAAMLFVFAL